MDEAINDILRALEQGDLNAKDLDRIIRAHSKRLHDGRRRIAKKHILPYFLQQRAQETDAWRRWQTTPELEERFIACLQMKPRRTASGVATITVITKPWLCIGTCIFCPNDIRMPKSYLHDEPACQRAERNYFDPYLQVASRLNALTAMGHATDKIELIVLGGTFTDYPEEYRVWFIEQLFACLNATDEERKAHCSARKALYASLGVPEAADEREREAAPLQAQIDAGATTYNAAFAHLYAAPGSCWQNATGFQTADKESLQRAHSENEHTQHRVVGLVVETRPDALSIRSLRALRTYGCTKVQMGIQSLDEDILAANGRPMSSDAIARAFNLCRLFGFKTHAHFMVNLKGADPAFDKAQYRILVEDGRFKPDEVKLYPCALVEGTQLMQDYCNGLWRPYTEKELIDVLRTDMLGTPAYTRVSRMIRDISSGDIVAGNKKTNLRQMVDQTLAGHAVREIRYREIGTQEVDLDQAQLQDIAYETEDTQEHFLQWVTPDDNILGFLRLSLPHPGTLAQYSAKPDFPLEEGQAMIREVHVYGFAAKIDRAGSSAQHKGLGKVLIEHAAYIARSAGYTRLNVISAVGTRAYYRKLGFADNGLYQSREL